MMMDKPDIILKAEQLNIGYQSGKTEKRVASSINLQLNRGELVCLLGPNGVGKSTLLRTLSGVQKPLSGNLWVDGCELKSLKGEALAKKISLVLTERISSGNLRVSELVALGRYPYTQWTGTLQDSDYEAVQRVIALTGIGYLQNERVYTLSDGQMQKVMIARALAQDGDLIILDEPTAHLDIHNKVAIMRLLQKIAHETQKAILLATHEIELAIQVADKLWLMDCNHPLYTGLPEELIMNGKLPSLFEQDGFRFDPANGRFRFTHNPRYFVKLNTAAPNNQWIEHALERKGIGIDKNAEMQIDANFDTGTFSIHFKNEIWVLSTLTDLLLECQKLLESKT
jgi:iron complex transport system ATP-binding protein